MKRAKTAFTTKKALVFAVGFAVIMTIFLLNARAASPFVSISSDQFTLSNGATAGNDSNAAGGDFFQFGSVTPPPGGNCNTNAGTPNNTFGPIGTICAPSTPSYAKAARFKVGSESELEASLNQANPGDVIEVTKQLSTSSIVINNDGGDNSQNVLVRGPLNQRISQSWQILGSYITVAGFNSSGAKIGLNVGTDKVERSGFWRISASGDSFWAIYGGTTDAFFVDGLAPKRISKDNDKFVINGYQGTVALRPLLQNLFIEGADRVTATAHTDTVQLVGPSGGNVRDPKIYNSYFVGSSNAAIQMGETVGTVDIQKTYLIAVADKLKGQTGLACNCGGAENGMRLIFRNNAIRGTASFRDNGLSWTSIDWTGTKTTGQGVVAGQVYSSGDTIPSPPSVPKTLWSGESPFSW